MPALSPEHPQTQTTTPPAAPAAPLAAWAGLLLGMVLPLTAVGFIAEDVLERERFGFEAPLLRWIHAHAGPTVTDFSVLLHVFGGPTVMAPLLVLLPAVLYWLGRRSAALLALLGLGGAAAIALGMKLLFDRPRPELWPRIVTEHGASFPSGHSTLAAAFATLVAVLLWNTRWRWLAVGLGIAYALLMAYSRMVLGVHYPTDVLAGLLTGMSVVLGTHRLLHRYGHLQ